MVRPFLRILIPTVLFAAASMATAAAEPVSVRGGDHKGYGRLVFNWPIPVVYSAAIVEGNLTVTFGRPIEASYGGAVRNLRRYLRGATPGSDGASVTFSLTGDFGLRHFYMGSAVVVDLMDKAPEPAAGAETAAAAPATAAAQPAADAPLIRVRTGAHEGYTRVVFDWPRRVGYRIDRSGGSATVIFDRRARVDLRRLKARPPKFISDLGSATTEGGLEVSLSIAESSRIKHFLSGPKVVLDVMAPSATEKAETPAAKPEPPAKVEEKKKEPEEKPEKKTEPGKQPEEPQLAEEAAPEPAKPPADEPAKEPAAAQATEATEAVEAPPTSLVPPGQEGGAPAAAKPGSGVTTVEGPVDAVTLRFDWPDPVGAAVFRRAGYLWVIFDASTDVDLEALTRAGGNAIRGITRVPVEQSTALRFDTVSGVNPLIRRDGLAWILEFRKQRLATPTPIQIQAEPNSPVGARVFLPVAQPGQAVIIADPEVGDNFVVVPVIPLGHGVRGRRDYPQFTVFGTAQGVAILPRIDDLRVRALVQGVELTSAGSLHVSEVTPKAEAASRMGPMRELTRVFDLERWRRADIRDFTETRREMQHIIAAATGEERQMARFDLVRYFFAMGLAPEALAVLRVIEGDNPEIIQDPEFRALRGASNLLMARYPEAEEDLGHASLDGNDEGEFWRAALRGASGDLVGAAEDLKRTGGITFPYPPALKFRMATMVAEAAIEVGDLKQATRYLEMLGSENPNATQKGQLLYVIGRLKELAGDFDGAIADWEESMEGRHRPSRAFSAVARAELLMKLREITRAEGIAELEKLRFAWRGDEFEFNLLRRMGTLYLEEGDARAGLRTLRQAATYFRKHEKAPEVTQEMADAFHKLYLEDGADILAPVTAIALYEEFKELTPAGTKGDEMIRKLADRLVGVDLLDRAVGILKNQVEFRLKGEEKARVGAQLAVVHMLNRDPDAAVKVLTATDAKGLPPELAAQRRHLLVRALAELEQTPKALALIKEDESREAELLRAELYWNTQDWSHASQALRRLVTEFEVTDDEALDERKGRFILNLAIALTLSGNERAVDRLRQKFGADMDNLSYKDAFRLIASPQTVGLLDHRSIADKVAAAEHFQEFMAAYRERVKTGNLSAIN